MSEAARWGLALAAALVLAVGVEAAPAIGAPLAGLIILALLLHWKGASNSANG